MFQAPRKHRVHQVQTPRKHPVHQVQAFCFEGVRQTPCLNTLFSQTPCLNTLFGQTLCFDPVQISIIHSNPNTPQTGCLASRVETGCSNTHQAPCSAQAPFKHSVWPNTLQTPCSAKHPANTLFSSNTPQTPCSESPIKGCFRYGL